MGTLSSPPTPGTTTLGSNDYSAIYHHHHIIIPQTSKARFKLNVCFPLSFVSGKLLSLYNFYDILWTIFCHLRACLLRSTFYSFSDFNYCSLLTVDTDVIGVKLCLDNQLVAKLEEEDILFFSIRNIYKYNVYYDAQ